MHSASGSIGTINQLRCVIDHEGPSNLSLILTPPFPTDNQPVFYRHLNLFPFLVTAVFFGYVLCLVINYILHSTLFLTIECPPPSCCFSSSVCPYFPLLSSHLFFVLHLILNVWSTIRGGGGGGGVNMLLITVGKSATCCLLHLTQLATPQNPAQMWPIHIHCWLCLFSQP